MVRVWFLTFNIGVGHEKPWPPNIVINCLHLLVWASLCVLFILFFKQCFSNGPETEIKRKTRIKVQYNTSILSYAHSWCLVPFRSNISYDRKNNVCLCCDSSAKVCQISNFKFRGEYTKSKLLYEARRHKQNSNNSNAFQSEWGFEVSSGSK